MRLLLPMALLAGTACITQSEFDDVFRADGDADTDADADADTDADADADTDADACPQVTETIPTHGMTNTPLDAILTVFFDIQPNGPVGAALEDGTVGVPMVADVQNTTFTWDPVELLTPGTTYHFTVDWECDGEGDGEEVDFTTVPATCDPGRLDFSSLGGQAAAYYRDDIRVHFDPPLLNPTVELTANGGSVGSRFEDDGSGEILVVPTSSGEDALMSTQTDYALTFSDGGCNWTTSWTTSIVGVPGNADDLDGNVYRIDLNAAGAVWEPIAFPVITSQPVWMLMKVADARDLDETADLFFAPADGANQQDVCEPVVAQSNVSFHNPYFQASIPTILLQYEFGTMALVESTISGDFQGVGQVEEVVIEGWISDALSTTSTGSICALGPCVACPSGYSGDCVWGTVRHARGDTDPSYQLDETEDGTGCR